MADNGHFDGSEDGNCASEDGSFSLYSFNFVCCLFYAIFTCTAFPIIVKFSSVLGHVLFCIFWFGLHLTDRTFFKHFRESGQMFVNEV